MYNEFYGLSRDPFLIVPDPNYLYLSPKHEEALARLASCIKQRRAVMVLTGEVGTGKTTLVRYLIGHLPASVHTASIANSNLAAEALLRIILTEFGLPVTPAGDKAALISALKNHLERLAAANRRGLLIIDEAQDGGLCDGKECSCVCACNIFFAFPSACCAAQRSDVSRRVRSRRHGNS